MNRAPSCRGSSSKPEPGADREEQDRHHRQSGTLHHRRSAPGCVSRHVYAHRFLHHRAEEVELPSNFVATINADMKLGSLAETITVSGQAPMVDVTQASRTDVVTREMLDVLPTTRHVFSVSNMLPGIRFATPDIGGSRQMEQTAPRGHGVNGAQAQEAVDGMSTSSQESNIVWTYVNDPVVQEVTVTTAAHPAEVQAGAMRMNMIPKDGGNVFSGSCSSAAATEAGRLRTSTTTCAART